MPHCKQLVLLVLASLWSCLAMAEQAPLQVLVAKVESRDMTDDIESLGTLYANETAIVTANITEVISRIRFNDGQRVNQGDVLVELTNREQLAQLEEAEAAQADAERQLQRARQLVESRFLSAQELDQREREFDIAQARLRAVQARLADRIIRAPFDSVVGLRQVSVGTLLTPGDAVATLHDDSVMKLDFRIPETLLAKVVPGQRISARSRAFVADTFEGEVAHLDNEIDPVTRSVRVRALLDNPQGRLKPGMLMSVTLQSQPREALIIPEEALLPVGRNQFVMRVVNEGDQQVAERQEVVVGQRQPGIVEIVKGLEVGDIVITHGNFRVQPGQPVRIKAELEPGESRRSALAPIPVTL